MTGKATKYLRQATVLLSVSLIVLVAVASYLEREMWQQRSDFSNNPNVHYIDVSRVDQGPAVSPLTFKDIDVIDGIAGGAAAGGKSTIPLFALNFGIPAGDGGAVFLYGVGQLGSSLLGVDEMKPGTAYFTSRRPAILNLSVPLIDVTAGGFESEEIADFDLETAQTGVDCPIEVMGRFAMNDAALLDEETFGEVVGLVFGTEWSEFKTAYSAGDEFGAEIIPRVFVDVEQLGDIERVGRALEDSGYATSYVLRAFSGMVESLGFGVVAGIGIAIVVFASGVTLTVLSFRSYFRLARRDMGILRHLGYSPRTVAEVYARRVARMVAIALGLALASALLLGAVLLREAFPLALANAGAVLVVVVALCAQVVLVDLRRTVRIPVLELLKLEREFE